MTDKPYALTAISTSGQADAFASLDNALEALSVTALNIKALAVPRSLAERRSARVYSLPPGVDLNSLKQSLKALEVQAPLDWAIQTVAARVRRYRLAVFDMDSTLIRCEVIDELAMYAGVGQQVSAITERAMRGELDFQARFI